MLSLPNPLRRLMLIEVAVSSFVNAVIFPVLLWLAPIPPPTEIGGADGVAMSLFKGTVIPVFLMTTLLTLILRKRLAKMDRISPVVEGRLFSLLSSLPRLAPLRALLFVVATLATVMPVALAIAWALKTYPLDELSFLGFNVVYGLVIGLVVTPFVVLASLLEGRTNIVS